MQGIAFHCSTNMIKGRMSETKIETNGPTSAARHVAVRTFMAVTLKKRPLDLTLGELSTEAGLSRRDRAFAYNLVMTSLRMNGGLERLLSGLLKSGLPKNATWTNAALITGLAQILLMRTADHAAVNETVELMKALPGKENGFSGLVNAVLRRAVREQGDLTKKLTKAPELYLPDWLRKNWVHTYGKATVAAIGRSLESTPPLDITLAAKEDARHWATALEATVLPTGSLRRSNADVSDLSGYSDGKWWVQDMAAAIPATLLGDVSGKHVLDMCAAPGGKTMQLASAGAHVTAVDRSAARLKRLSENLVRTNLTATVVTADAGNYVPKTAVDHILLDAPCSATGTLRRNPDVLWTKDQKDVEKLVNLQARLLQHAFSMLPVGGKLVYCVCSIEPGEGHDQIDWFLEQTDNAAREPITPDEIGNIGEFLTPSGDLLCLPGMSAIADGTDGFFAARLIKR